MIGKVINFRKNADQCAAIWCRENNLQGLVVEEERGLSKIDVGLYYFIYAKSNQIQIAEDQNSINGVLRVIDGVERLSPELRASAPTPE